MTSPPLILVVEDNEVNQLLTASVLEREGFEVDLAGSSAQAIERLDSRKPETLAAGCAGYISKPIDTRTFGSQVREFLHSTVPTSRPARTDARLNGT